MNIIKSILKIKNFKDVLFDYYLPRNTRIDYVVRMRNGLNVCIRPKKRRQVGDIDIFKEIIIDGEYKVGEIIKEGDIVVDIGANIGIFSLLVSKEVANVKIYSYEPHEGNFEMLNKNVLLNKSYNITTFNEAVLGEEGNSFLFISKENTGGHSIYNNGNMQAEAINGVSLSNVIKERKPNVLKIDCEGAEYEMFLKTPISRIKEIDKIILEQHITPETLKRFDKRFIVRYLKKCGFNITILRKIVYPSEGEFWIMLAEKPLRKVNTT